MQEPCEMEHGRLSREIPEAHCSVLSDILEEDASSDVCSLFFKSFRAILVGVVVVALTNKTPNASKYRFQLYFQSRFQRIFF